MGTKVEHYCPSTPLSSKPDPTNEPGSSPLVSSSQQRQQQPQSRDLSDLMAEIREQTWAWNGVKRNLARWAAENEGKSITKGEVTISSSTKSASGVDAPSGYHFITLKQGSTTIELLVHDASGDIRRDSMFVNGGKMKDFTTKVTETFGKLKVMVDAMKNPAVPEQQNNPENTLATNTPGSSTPGNTPVTQSRFEKLKGLLNDDKVVASILAEVREHKPEVLADIASKVSINSKPEEKAIAGMISAFGDLARLPALNSGSFSKLGADVEQVMKKLPDMTPDQRKPYFNQWLNAMDDYLRVYDDRHIVIEDDNGKQFLLGETVQVVPAPQKLQGLYRIPDNENGRIVSFLAVRAMIIGSYNPTEILGFTSQCR